MKKISKHILFFVFIVTVNNICISQSKIDKINTSEELQNFIWNKFPEDKKLYKELEKEKKEVLETYPEGYEKIFGLSDFEKKCKTLYEAKSSSFLKVDFDRNGKTDILVLQYESDNPSPFLILDFGKKVERYWIPNKGFDNCFYPTIDTLDGKTCIVNFNCFDVLTPNTPKCKIDTLILFEKSFIELKSPSNHKISKIEFKINNIHCFGCNYDDFEIIINSDLSTKFKVSSKDSTYTLDRISNSKFQHIQKILNIINFPKLNSNYERWISHALSAEIKIEYDNGNIKEIKDYGMEGTYGLIEIYSTLEDIFIKLKKQNRL